MKMWRVKAIVVPVVIRAPSAVTPEARQVAQADLSINIQDLCPEECSPRISKDIAQDPQAAGLWKRTQA